MQGGFRCSCACVNATSCLWQRLICCVLRYFPRYIFILVPVAFERSPIKVRGDRGTSDEFYCY